MKIVIQKSDIERVLVKSIPFLESKDMSMITSNVLIALSGGAMTVNATDYEIGLRSTIQTLGIVTDGSCVVNGKKLLDIIKILKNDNVTIEAKEDTLFMLIARYSLLCNMQNNMTLHYKITIYKCMLKAYIIRGKGPGDE